MKSRIYLLFTGFFVIWLLLIMRAAFLQIFPNEKLARLHQKQFNTVVELTPRRGFIYDRNGVELAASVAAHSLYADPQMVRHPKYVAEKLSKVLRISKAHLLQKLREPRRFVWVARRLNRKMRAEVEKLGITGLSFVEESRRIFPNEKMLSHVLGFVGGEGQGLEGLEAKFEENLHGFKKRLSVQKDALGRPLIVNGRVFRETLDGSDITLTVDSELQYALEQILNDAQKEQNAKGALGIILDAKTSEILAIATVPQFDPNEPLRYPAEVRRNRAVTDPIEPGSTMKTFTMAAALKERVAAPNTKYYCEQGRFQIGKRVIRESDSKHKFEWLTMDEILALSSNVGSSKIALNLGAKVLYNSLSEFGFGQKSGVDLMGESRGHLPAPPWNHHLTANISFGHGLSATPIQIVNAYAAIANGGKLHRPYIVKSIRHRDTGEVETFGSQFVRNVLSEKDAATLRLMLMGVTSEGATGFKARVRGFPVAGKTGTAQKLGPDGKYSSKDYYSSFVGFLPANDPKFVIFVSLDEPQENYYGSEVAAPLFSKLATLSVRRAGLQPTLISQANVLKKTSSSFQAANDANSILRDFTAKEDVQASVIPSVEGLTLREALRLLKNNEISVEFLGKGRVAKMNPPAGFPLVKPQKVYLTLRE